MFGHVSVCVVLAGCLAVMDAGNTGTFPCYQGEVTWDELPLTPVNGSYLRRVLAVTVDGMWGDWAAWGTCSDTDTRTRSRQCDSPQPMYGGSDCFGLSSEIQPCTSTSYPRLQCSGPAEEGMPHTLSYLSQVTDLDDLSAIMEYYDFGLEDRSGPAAGCVTCLNSSMCGSPDRPLLFLANGSTAPSGNLFFTLNITQVERPLMETRWEWKIPGREAEFCYLNIYVFNTTPTCEQPFLHYLGTPDNPIPMARVKCSMSAVYPVPVFKFTAHRTDNNTKADPSATIVYEDVFNYESPTYFIKNAIAQFPVLDVYPGQFNLKVTATPGLQAISHLNTTAESSQTTLGIGSVPCSTPYLNEDNTHIMIDCHVVSAYPEINCRFYQLTNMDTVEIGFSTSGDDISYSSAVCKPGFEGCKVTCRLSRNLSSVPPGTFTFKADVTPVLNFTDLPITESTVSPVVVFALPTVDFGECPFDQNGNSSYLDPSVTYTCQCLTTGAGYPPGRIAWFNSTGHQIVEGDEVIEDAILTMKYAEGGNIPYQCRGMSSIGSGAAVTYTPRFAAGPDNATIVTTTGLHFDLCPSDSTAEMTLSCDVYHVTVEGVPTVRLTGVPVGNFDPVSNSTLQEGVLTQYSFQFRPTSHGIYSVTCTAYDPVYPALSVSTSAPLTIYSPPTSPPSISSDQGSLQGSVLTVTEGLTVQFSCHVSGGFPEVTSTNITCAGLQNQTVGNESSITFEMTRGHHQGKCVCKAEHTTGCYTNESDISFNVLYQASITDFTSQGVAGAIEVSKNSAVMFDCEAQGNPRPQISVKGQRSGAALVAANNPPEPDFVKSFTSSKVMASCLDTDVYICTSDNGIVGTREKSVTVSVQCTPELVISSQQNQTKNVDEGSSLSVVYSIIRFPKLRDVVLYKEASSGQIEVPTDRYYHNVTPGVAPFSQVTVGMRNVTPQDIGQYVITMGNGVGDPISLRLRITVNLDESGAVSSEEKAAVITGTVGGVLCLLATLIAISVYRSYVRHYEAQAKSTRQETNRPRFGSQTPVQRHNLNLAYERDYYANMHFTRSQLD